MIKEQIHITIFLWETEQSFVRPLQTVKWVQVVSFNSTVFYSRQVSLAQRRRTFLALNDSCHCDTGWRVLLCLTTSQRRDGSPSGITTPSVSAQSPRASWTTVPSMGYFLIKATRWVRIRIPCIFLLSELRDARMCLAKIK